jgi:predicted ABC-type exoprotein transport system permease subunit
MSIRMSAEGSNRYAITSLLLGMTSLVLLLVIVVAFFSSFDEAELDAWIWILYIITLVAAICALPLGTEGRRLAKDRRGRVMATVGSVLAIVFIVVSIACVVLTLMYISSISRDSL